MNRQLYSNYGATTENRFISYNSAGKCGRIPLFITRYVCRLDRISRIETTWKPARIAPFTSLQDKSGEDDVAIRLYLSALTFLFLFLVWMSRGVGVLEATVVVSALLYLIIDTREHLRIVRTELDLLKQLEKTFSLLH